MMANQRMFLRCKACGNEKFIAKRGLRAFHTLRYRLHQWEAEWDEWFEKHEWGFCDPEGRKWSFIAFILWVALT